MKVHKLKDVMSFGKHKGTSIEKLLLLEGGDSYLRWIINEIDNFLVTDCVYDEICEKVAMEDLEKEEWKFRNGT